MLVRLLWLLLLLVWLLRVAATWSIYWMPPAAVACAGSGVGVFR